MRRIEEGIWSNNLLELLEEELNEDNGKYTVRYYYVKVECQDQK